MSRLLNTVAGLPVGIAHSNYDRAQLKAGILHLGPGAFFRSHLAVYTDDALEASGGDWGIAAGGLRSGETAELLNAQNGLYTLLVRRADGADARVVGAVTGGVAPSDLLLRMCDPAIRIVSLTISEKGYGLDAATGALDISRSDIAADLASPANPCTAVGLIVGALGRRRAAGLAPFTPLSCDNLNGNGDVLRRLAIDFAGRCDPGLADWIADAVPFPSTMVDRITPASTATTYADATRLTGALDRLAVEAEPYSQWVIEDRFAAGRPDWDRGGALFVNDVSPYEKMKLRMLNGTHSLLAYLSLMAGHEYVRDAMADPRIVAAARRHLVAATGTLDPVPGVDLGAYTEELLERFANPSIAHRTAQIAMDGTQKLPPRIFEPASEVLANGGNAESFALVTAAWIHHVTDSAWGDGPKAVQDPRWDEIRAALPRPSVRASKIVDAMIELPGLFPPALRSHTGWRNQVAALLERFPETVR